MFAGAENFIGWYARTLGTLRERHDGHSRRRLTLLAAFAALCLGGAAVDADVIPWTGAVDDDWNTPGNWAGGVMPEDADTAEFHADGAANLSVTLSSESTIDALAFGSNATDPVTINVSGAALLRLDGGAATDIEVLAGSHTIEGQGNGSGEPSEMLATGAHHWHVAENAMLVINARLLGASWPSSNTYTKSGGGTLVLGNNNSGSGGWNFHSGWFALQEGTVRLNHPVASGDWHNNYTVHNGATLEASNGISSLEMRHGTLSLSGEGVGGVGSLLITTGATTTYPADNGSMFLQSDATINVSAESTFIIDQKVTGTGIGASLTKIGEGTLILTSPETSYGGSGSNERTTISEGMLTLAPGGELRIRILNNGVSHRIDGSGTANLEGVLRLRTNQVTDTKGTWNIVDVSTLTVNWGGTFNLAFLDEEETFTDQGGGIFTSGEWTFNQATGNLTLGDVKPECAPDLDGDSAVGVSDLLLLLSEWGECASCEADLDGDDSVGVSDLLLLLADWGSCP